MFDRVFGRINDLDVGFKPQTYLMACGPSGSAWLKNYLPNPLTSMPEFLILLWLTSYDFTRQGETWTGKG